MSWLLSSVCNAYQLCQWFTPLSETVIPQSAEVMAEAILWLERKYKRCTHHSRQSGSWRQSKGKHGRWKEHIRSRFVPCTGGHGWHDRGPMGRWPPSRRCLTHSGWRDVGPLPSQLCNRFHAASPLTGRLESGCDTVCLMKRVEGKQAGAETVSWQRWEPTAACTIRPYLKMFTHTWDLL